jgi:hypothetical protein
MKKLTHDLKRYFSFLKNGNYLPCYILSEQPMVLVSYFFDFVNQVSHFVEELPTDRRITCLFQLGYHVETEKRLAEILAGLESIREHAQDLDLNIIFLTNTETEASLIASEGYQAKYCHQNAFLDESKYRVIEGAEKSFDAVYLARFTPCKRQELACEIPQLKLIGSFLKHERSYYDMAREATSHATFKEKVYASNVYKHLNEAHVGLCLSDAEGAMFVSAEYLLCGLSVVTTENLGGREKLFPKFAFRYADADATAINHAVQVLKKQNLDPHAIRSSTVAMMQKHREVLVNIVQEVCDEEKVSGLFADKWSEVFIHKLGLRTAIPQSKRKHGTLRPGQFKA